MNTNEAKAFTIKAIKREPVKVQQDRTVMSSDTLVQVNCNGSRWRRVFVLRVGNSGTPFIVIDKKTYRLTSDFPAVGDRVEPWGCAQARARR